MKTIITVITILFIGAFHAHAAESESVTQYLPAMMQEVRYCAVVPVKYNERGNKTAFAMVSHCPEVQTLGTGKATLKVSDQVFEAQITDSVDTDGGDLNDLVITNVNTRETYKRHNVLAFGDVLLAVLHGNEEGLTEVPTL